VIATTTKVPLDGVKLDGLDDKLFARGDDAGKTEDATFTSPARKAAQTAVDGALTKNVEKVEFLSAYLKAKFSLSNSDKPHLLKF
jgi:hypothetical protein